MSLQSFVFLLQHCSRLSRLEDLVLPLALVATMYFCYDSLLSFSKITSVVTEFPLSQQYSVHSSNNYVAASIIISQYNFNATSASWCRDPSFHVTTALRFYLVAIMFSHDVIISVTTQKFNRDIVLLP